MNQEDYIRDNYKKIPSKKIAENLGISYQKVQSIARYIGVAKFSTKIESIIEDVLQDYYARKMTVQQIREKFQIGKSTVLDILRLRGEGGRKPHETGIIYECDIDFFESIDAPEKAYWFGFIAADGNICNGKLQIRLHSKDINHLKKFCKRIKYNGTIFKEKKRPVCGVIITRKKMIHDLKKQGLTENKTLNIDHTIFDKIPKQYLNSAFLGYFDGDGSFSSHKKYKSNLQMSMIGNKSFLEYWCDFFTESGIVIDKKKIKKDKRTKQTYLIFKSINKDNLNKLQNIFYHPQQSSKDFLDRKHQKLVESLRYVES